jgi:hypothetical protein
MQFSTDLPAGVEQVKAHIESGARLGIPRRRAKVVPIAAKCLHCGLVLHDKSNADTTRTDSRFCDSTCQRNARHAKAGSRRLQEAA